MVPESYGRGTRTTKISSSSAKARTNGGPPTNWESKFGGNAWEYVEKFDEYYLHLFDVTQADLNWENENVRKEIQKILKFWMEKGRQRIPI